MVFASSGIVYASISMIKHDLINCNSLIDYTCFIMQIVTFEKMDISSIANIVKTEEIIFKIDVIDMVNGIDKHKGIAFL